MRTLLVALLLVVPLAGCIVDPGEDVVPAAVAPEPATAPPVEPAPRETPQETPPPPPEPAPAPEPVVATPPPPPPPPRPVYVVEHRFGNITAGAGAASPDGSVCCVGGAPADDAATQTATVASGARAFVVELRWDSLPDQAEFDLDLVVLAPDYREREPQAPSGVPSGAPDTATYSGHRFAATATDLPSGRTARIHVDDPAVLSLAGEWTIEVRPKGPAAQVPFQVALTSVLGMPPEEGYSAFA